MMGEKTPRNKEENIKNKREKCHIYGHKVAFIAKAEPQNPFLAYQDDSRCRPGSLSLTCTITLATCDSCSGIRVETKELEEKRLERRLAR